MTAYYNEIEPYAAAWLRNLIAAGAIAPGDVDERDIRDVRPDELRGYTQCHFFAGIGVWSYALRLAGWPDDSPVWTGSCPCQPFSAAGRGDGFADERHLWPHFHHLISQCRPSVVFGEQVASKDGLGWLDLVQTDLEGTGYAVWATDLCAAGVGAPHIRQRLWWVADAYGQQHDGRGVGRAGRWLEHSDRRAIGLLADTMQPGRPERWSVAGLRQVAGSGASPLANAHQHRCASLPSHGGATSERDAEPCGQYGVVGDAESVGRQGRQPVSGTNSWRLDAGTGAVDWLGDTHHQGPQACEREAVVGKGRREEGRAVVQSGGASGGLADAEGSFGSHRLGEHGPDRQHVSPGARAGGRDGVRNCPARVGEMQRAHQGAHRSEQAVGRPGPTNGFWRDADWLLCRDGKWRPVEPGTFPLAHGAPARVGRLRAYGNAISPWPAKAFIEAYLDSAAERFRLSEMYVMAADTAQQEDVFE